MKNKKRIATLMALLLGGIIAMVMNCDWSTAFEADTVKKVTIITKSGCKPSKRTCYTEQIGDSIVTHKGRLREKVTIEE